MQLKILLLLPLFVVGACNSPQLPTSNVEQYKVYMHSDSLAKLWPDSAFYYYYEASEQLTDSGYKGTALQKMALIQQGSGDYNGSLESTTRSTALFDKKNSANYIYLSYNYNLLATNCLNLDRYDDAVSYYDSAFRYSDSSNLPLYRNNKGVAFQKEKAYDKAISLYELALREATAKKDTLVYTKVLSNLARARWLRDSGYPAVKEFQEAKRLRELKNDQWGLNASYSHLADYYTATKPDSGLHYAKKMYKVATALNSAADQVESLEKLIRLSSGKDLQTYFSRYDALSDSINLARSTAKNQYADIRFNSEEAQTNNLLLEKDNVQKKFRIVQQRYIIYGTIAFFVMLSILGVSWYRKRKRVQELQTKNAVRESKLKTSQKVHDVVANGLYRIMNELEHGKEIEKEPLLDKIEALYEKSRDISYEDLTVAASADQHNQLHELLMGFDDEQTKVFIVGDMQSFRGRISAHQKDELQLVLTELMVNMKKHSRAKNVIVEFKQEGGKAVIHYKDDGIGFGPDPEFGNGMKNTVSRIQALKGDVNFGKSGKAGAFIIISFPV
jgi:hypothetical protein